MKKLTAIFTLSLVLVSCGKSNSSGKTSSSSSSYNSSLAYGGSVEEQTSARNSLVNMINSHRARIGVQALRSIELTHDEAQAFVRDMADGVIAVRSFSQNQRCLRDRQSMGVGGYACAEITSMGATNVKDAFKAWMGSSRQREVLESNRYSRIGIGIESDRSGRLYWTALLLQ